MAESTTESVTGTELRWQCRRGLLELDLLLEAFLDHGYDALDESGRARFTALLQHADPDLQAWLIHAQQAPAEWRALITRIRQTRP